MYISCCNLDVQVTVGMKDRFIMEITYFYIKLDYQIKFAEKSIHDIIQCTSANLPGHYKSHGIVLQMRIFCTINLKISST